MYISVNNEVCGLCVWYSPLALTTVQVMGDMPRAIENHEKHLSLSSSLGNQTGVMWAYGNIAAIYESCSNYKKVQSSIFSHFALMYRIYVIDGIGLVWTGLLL